MDVLTGIVYVSYLVGGIFALVIVINIISLRVVVPTNAVHIVQSGRKTTSYGKDMGGNTYYRWPAWIPGIGVRVSVLPLSVFRVELESYAAYDKGRLPFVLDVLAFFRISDASKAAERLSSIQELDGQLQGIMQGVVRTILANAEIEDILGKRAEFSESFTKEVAEQLPQWGIETVKNIELMDIRDGAGSLVIQQIMAKKKSEIEKESRVAVAGNAQLAEVAELNARQTVGIRQQEAEQAVGERNAQKTQAVGIAGQKAEQAVAEEAKTTAEKNMAVNSVNKVRAAEIERDVQVVQADQIRQTAVIHADGEKQQTVTVAEGTLAATKLAAEGITATGVAKASAEQALQLAPVNAQVTLAKEIGANAGYQQYLVTIRNIEMAQAVGVVQAQALQHAEIKIIANTGKPNDGISNVMDIFSAAGGSRLGAMVEGFANTDAGKTVTAALNGAGRA